MVLCSKDLDVDMDALWQQGCDDVYNALCEVTHNGYYYCDPFMNPVDEEHDGAPGYYTVVTKPMCLKHIRERLDAAIAKRKGKEVT